jgi:hypothetical protein
MALKLTPVVLIIAVLSWLLSFHLLIKLWKSVDLLTIKIALSALLLVPVAGPLAYFWIQAFPEPSHPELQDRLGFRANLTHRWRNWFEAIGKLPPLVQHFRKRRRQNK